MFSFYLTGHLEDSYIDFGPYDENAITSMDDLVWLDVIQGDKLWSNTVTGLKWSHKSSELYRLEQTKAFTDTGTSCIIGPQDYIKWILETLEDILVSSQSSLKWGTIFDCQEINSLPSFYLLFGGYWFEVLPKDYTVVTDSNLDECAFCL